MPGRLVAPPFMSHIVDVHSMRVGFSAPLACFVFIAPYGATRNKLEANDSSI